MSHYLGSVHSICNCISPSVRDIPSALVLTPSVRGCTRAIGYIPCPINHNSLIQHNGDVLITVSIAFYRSMSLSSLYLRYLKLCILKGWIRVGGEVSEDNKHIKSKQFLWRIFFFRDGRHIVKYGEQNDILTNSEKYKDLVPRTKKPHKRNPTIYLTRRHGRNASYYSIRSECFLAVLLLQITKYIFEVLEYLWNFGR